MSLLEKFLYSRTMLNDQILCANGNLKILTRNGVQKAGQQRAMDNFEYHYEDLDESQLQGNNKFKRETNRLSYVTDDVTASNYDDDIDGHQIDNYSYDGIGNLTKDVDEQIEEIVWHVNGKVKEVKRTAGSEKSDLAFFYDAMGNRTIKLEKPRNGSGLQSEDNWVYTYYSRDAQGNVMGIYKRSYEAKPAGIYEEKLKLEEQSIFGSSRAGLYRSDLTVATRNFTATLNAVDKTLINQTEISVENTPRYTNLTSHYLGKKSYELSNHLGNVLVVLSDRVDAQNSGTQVTGYNAVVVSANDYYPFGSPMPERSFSSPSYRYGFNGMEKDDEFTGSQSHYDFGTRMYDSRLGRWMSIDPLAGKYPNISPYVGIGNNPIIYIDPNGETITIVTYNSKGKKATTTVFKSMGELLKADFKGNPDALSIQTAMQDYVNRSNENGGFVTKLLTLAIKDTDIKVHVKTTAHPNANNGITIDPSYAQEMYHNLSPQDGPITRENKDDPSKVEKRVATPQAIFLDELTEDMLASYNAGGGSKEFRALLETIPGFTASPEKATVVTDIKGQQYNLTDFTYEEGQTATAEGNSQLKQNGVTNHFFRELGLTDQIKNTHLPTGTAYYTKSVLKTGENKITRKEGDLEIKDKDWKKFKRENKDGE